MVKMVKEGRASMQSHLIICAAAMGLVLGFAARGEAASYTFTRLEDSSGSFLRFGFASINDVGRVAFSAALDTDGDGIMDGSGIFTSDGTTTTTIADNSGPFDLFGALSFNDGGAVAFWASLDAGGNGIFTSDGTTTTTIADNSGPFSSFNSPSINNSGAVAFWASFDGGGTGIFASDGTTTTTIDDTNGPFSFLNLPSINNGGTVVFTGFLDAGGTGIFAGSGGPVSTIVDDSGVFSFFNFPSGNDGGTVVFWARLDTGVFGIFTNDGTTVADTGGPFTNFTNPAINTVGSKAFQAFLTGGSGIFTGPDPLGDKVIAIGDPLSGSTVTTVIFSREGLNDAGQIAFVASLADDTQAVYRADPEDGGDPVPTPGPVPLPVPSPDPDLDPVNVTIDIKPGSDRNSVNLGSQGVVRVAILSTSTFDAATVDPASINLSGAYEKQKGKGTLMASYKDVNRDGLLDLVVHVETQSLSLAESTATAESTPKVTLTGTTYDGTIITGSDSIHSVP
jgi:hypothetical protein